MEGIQAQTDIGAVDCADDLPDVFPGGGVGGPAPVLVGEAEVAFREVVGQFAEVGDDLGPVCGDFLGGGVCRADLFALSLALSCLWSGVGLSYLQQVRPDHIHDLDPSLDSGPGILALQRVARPALEVRERLQHHHFEIVGVAELSDLAGYGDDLGEVLRGDLVAQSS